VRICGAGVKYVTPQSLPDAAPQRGGPGLSQPLTDEERAQIEARIAALEIEHHDLDDVIARLSEHPDQDQLQLRRFKKRKLMLKDSIARLKVQLVPDIPA
jgi:hypothetical protein